MKARVIARVDYVDCQVTMACDMDLTALPRVGDHIFHEWYSEELAVVRVVHWNGLMPDVFIRHKIASSREGFGWGPTMLTNCDDAGDRDLFGEGKHGWAQMGVKTCWYNGEWKNSEDCVFEECMGWR